MTIEIDKHVPIPPSGKYPFDELEIGDSFLVPNANSHNIAAASYAGARRTGYKFRTKTVDGGVRVWRIK